MSWASAIRKTTPRVKPAVSAQAAFAPAIVPADIDWDRLVSLDFETYYDADYTLSKLSTSEYIRDERFEALMVAPFLMPEFTRCASPWLRVTVVSTVPFPSLSICTTVPRLALSR